jgi:hypothetical protein
MAFTAVVDLRICWQDRSEGKSRVIWASDRHGAEGPQLQPVGKQEEETVDLFVSKWNFQVNEDRQKSTRPAEDRMQTSNPFVVFIQISLELVADILFAKYSGKSVFAYTR